MIYNEYEIVFYKNSKTGREPVLEYIRKLNVKERTKIGKYLEYLQASDGYLDEPYSKHIKDKIRELRVDFSNNHHRILYFTFINKKILLLHAFLKKTTKTPENEIGRALINYHDVINNRQMYE